MCNSTFKTLKKPNCVAPLQTRQTAQSTTNDGCLEQGLWTSIKARANEVNHHKAWTRSWISIEKLAFGILPQILWFLWKFHVILNSVSQSSDELNSENIVLVVEEEHQQPFESISKKIRVKHEQNWMIETDITNHLEFVEHHTVL